MKIAHLADLHLGFRQFNRETRGLNTREIDIADAFRRTTDDLITQRPDAIVIAGDVMHFSKPRSSPIMLLFNNLRKIREALPATKIVMIAGNHDVAHTMELGKPSCILQLYEHLDVAVAVADSRVTTLPGGVAITAVPSPAVQQIIKPDPAAALNVLVIHGQVPSHVYPHAADPAERVDVDELERMGWDYVALGDYHVCHQVGEQMWYSGSLEYTSTDPWTELRKQAELGVPGKGYLLVDFASGKPVVTFRPIGPTRRFVELAPIEGTDKTAAELDVEIASRVAETEIDGAVVRLVVREVRREVKRGLNHAQIRQWQGRALHFQLELRRAECETSTPATRVAMHKRLDETVEAFLRGRELPKDIENNREKIVALGLDYLKAAALKEDPYTGEQLQL